MTAIAAICRHDEIVIAADSRRLNFTTGEQTSVCKIRDLTTLFAAVSGINSYDATQFNVSVLLPVEMPDVDIRTNVNSVRDLVLPPLTLALEHLRNNNPELFQRYALQKSPLDIKFVRVQDGRPTMINFGVVVADHGAVSAERERWCQCRNTCIRVSSDAPVGAIRTEQQPSLQWILRSTGTTFK